MKVVIILSGLYSWVSLYMLLITCWSIMLGTYCYILVFILVLQLGTDLIELLPETPEVRLSLLLICIVTLLLCYYDKFQNSSYNAVYYIFYLFIYRAMNLESCGFFIPKCYYNQVYRKIIYMDVFDL